MLERPACNCFRSKLVSPVHTLPQDTTCRAWHRLLELIDETAASGASELDLNAAFEDPREYWQIVTLPASIGKLKKLQMLGTYGSNLDRLPPEIGDLESLEVLDIYTSYRLHWLPFEVTRCSRLRSTRMSTRALYGNYKYRPHFPRLYETFESLPQVTPGECSVCRAPLGFPILRRWISLKVGTDVTPLLVNACSYDCLEALPAPPPHYVPEPHTGGSDIQQPPPR